MNAQEIFDTVVTHLLTQGVRSANGDICLYRGPNGTSCAVGCLIPDEMYEPEMDTGYSAISLIYSDRFKLPEYFNSDNTKLLSRLQGFHDGIDEDVIVYNDKNRATIKKIARDSGVVFDESKFERFRNND